MCGSGDMIIKQSTRQEVSAVCKLGDDGGLCPTNLPTKGNKWNLCLLVHVSLLSVGPHTPVPLLVRLVQHPGVGKGRLPGLLGLLLVLVHGALVDVAQQVEQVAHQRALTCIHVT